MSLFFIQNVNATHIMGGEITWECIKDPTSPNVGQYIFTMKLYRDCDGTTLPVTAQNIEVWEDGVNIQNISCPFLVSSDISPNCNVANSGNAQLDCYGTNPAGAVEEYIYQSAPVSLNQGATPGVPPLLVGILHGVVVVEMVLLQIFSCLVLQILVRGLL